jgi:UDP-glucose 4-epimerase
MESSEAAGRVYNIGSDEEITMEALADTIIRLTGSRSNKVFLSYEEAYGRPFDDMKRRVPSLERIRGTVGYQPRYTLEQTLSLIINSMREKK